MDCDTVPRIEARLQVLERLLRMQLPQVWTLEMLVPRYPSWSASTIKRMAQQHAGYHPRRGNAFALTIHQVERLDRAIELGEAVP